MSQGNKNGHTSQGLCDHPLATFFVGSGCRNILEELRHFILQLPCFVLQ